MPKLFYWFLAAVTLAATPAFAVSSSGSDIGYALGALVVLAALIAGYFFPSIIAVCRRHHNTLAIFLLNLFLGWSGLGWVGALVWAATVPGERR
jgi:hypothetical protein